MAIPEGLETRVASLGNGTLEYVPAALLTRFAIGWAEGLEGGVAGDEKWAKLAMCRARLLLTWIRPEEKFQKARARLQLWEQGRIDELLTRVEGAQAQHMAKRQEQATAYKSPSELEKRQGQSARKCAAKQCYRKAMMAFSQKGVHGAKPEERKGWAQQLIPRTENPMRGIQRAKAHRILTRAGGN